MTREQAVELLQQHLLNRNLVKHCLAVEACMKEFAGRFAQDPEPWAMAGLLHDLDYAYTVDTPAQHSEKTADMLAEYSLAGEIIHAIKAHNLRVEPSSKMDIALLTIDPASGFIIACALMHPDKKLASLDLAFLKKRFKEKSFAKGASREQMEGCVKLGLSLDEFLQLCLSAMQKIAPELGL
ncbi:MAG: HDIG domain-containing protein [Candidatus Aminicenantes bacterium]|nr:HDIG domain-containing protein [Candidatus Aminicenantes bacterium]